MIEESEEAIKMAEQGILPKNDFLLVSKIENYLGIRIRDELFREQSFDEEVEKVKENFSQSVEKDKIKFDEVTTKTLTIADLQEMKKKRESAPQAYPEKSSTKILTKGKIFEKPVENKIDFDKEDISQEDIDRIIFI